ncbi:hypothetical protein V6N13_070959 [Hibiscus sabdariffa]
MRRTAKAIGPCGARRRGSWVWVGSERGSPTAKTMPFRGGSETLSASVHFPEDRRRGPPNTTASSPSSAAVRCRPPPSAAAPEYMQMEGLVRIRVLIPAAMAHRLATSWTRGGRCSVGRGRSQGLKWLGLGFKGIYDGGSEVTGRWECQAVIWLGPGQNWVSTAAPLCSLLCNDNRAKTKGGPVLSGMAQLLLEVMTFVSIWQFSLILDIICSTTDDGARFEEKLIKLNSDEEA